MKKILVCLTQFIMILTMGVMVYGEQADSDVTQEYQENGSLYVEGQCFMKGYAASYEDKNYFPRGVKYDESTNTLTLEDCNLVYKGGAGRDGVIEYRGNRSLNIVIKGHNTMNIGEKDYSWYEIMNDGIYVSSLDDTKEVQVNITGDGTLNVDNVSHIIGAYDRNTNVSIEGVTIHSGFAGIYSGGMLSIKKSKVFIKDSSLTAVNSYNNVRKSAEVVCLQYDFDGEHVYAGNGKLEKEIKSEELFEKVNIKDMEMYQKKINYDWILLSDEVADLKNYNPVSKTTSVKAPGKTKIKRITAKKKSAKKVKILLKKIRKAKGYLIAFYKTKKQAAKNKNAIVKKYVKKTSVTVTSKKLKDKKTLYVKACAYKLDGKKKIYGKWSKVKKVKIKK